MFPMLISFHAAFWEGLRFQGLLGLKIHYFSLAYLFNFSQTVKTYQHLLCLKSNSLSQSGFEPEDFEL